MAGHSQAACNVFVALPPTVIRMLFSNEAWRELEAVAHITVMADSLPADLGSRYDVVITGWGTPLIESLDGSRLKLAVHSAGGFGTNISHRLIREGLEVSQAGSDPMARAVAECALTLTLMMLRELHTYDRGMRETRDFTKVQNNPLLSETIISQAHGLIGLSRTGQHHARLLRGLGVENVVAYDPYVSAEVAESLDVRLTTLDDALTQDVVAVHVPVTKETRGMIGARELALIPDGALLINTARSAVIDMKQLTPQLIRGRIRAALDVFDEEPLPADSPLHGLPNVVLTPHVAGGTRQARLQMGDAVVAEVTRFTRGEPRIYAVRSNELELLS